MTVYDDEKIVGIREEGWVKENIDGFVVVSDTATELQLHF